MPPTGFRPPQMPGMKAPRPAIQKPGAPKPPRIPGAPRAKPADPNEAATQNAMSAFRTALAQLKASTPAVDANAIRAPYQAASVATGQLGQGLQQAVLGAGQAAQNQYNMGFGEAQKTAAQFGISAGAGAQPTALANNGNQMIAQQTQAQATAAPQAASAWQQLLERTSAAKVADANLQRQNSLTSAEQSLSGSIPGAIQNEKQLGFQKDTARKNFALAVGTQRDRATNDLRNYLLGATKVQTSAASSAANTDVRNRALAQKTANDKAKLAVSQQALALKQRAQTAKASGLQGVPAAVKALTGTTTGAGSKKSAKGFDVMIQPWTYADASDKVGKPNGPAVSKHLPRLDATLPGYKVLKDTATTHYATVPTSASSSGGVSRATWDAQMRSLLAQNPGQAAAVRALLGPRPKK